jgi:hypothetical protein
MDPEHVVGGFDDKQIKFWVDIDTLVCRQAFWEAFDEDLEAFFARFLVCVQDSRDWAHRVESRPWVVFNFDKDCPDFDIARLACCLTPDLETELRGKLRE